MNTSRTGLASLCLLAAASVTAAATAQRVGCEIVLSNLPTPLPPASEFVFGTNLGQAVDGVPASRKAVGFTTGDTALEFDSAVVVVINPADRDQQLFGGIFSSDSAGDPDEQLAAFAPDTIPAGSSADLVVSTLRLAEPGFVLETNTQYWIVVDGDTILDAERLNWTSREPEVEPTPAPGITFDGYQFENPNGDWRSSGVPNVLHLTSCPVGGPPCLADTNGDGMLAPDDFTAWIFAFNASGFACDQNGDGVCSAGDFNAWILNFNAGCP